MLTSTNITVPASLVEDACIMLGGIDFKLSINAPTGRFFYDRWEIREEFAGTPLDKLVSYLPTAEIGEARIIRLSPGNSYLAHSDMDDRYHLNLQSSCSYLIDIDSEVMHKIERDLTWYIMNAGVRHTAANFGEIDRYQLVVRKLLNINRFDNPVTIEIAVNKTVPRFRYIFDKDISPWLNRANKNNMVSDFEYTSETSIKFVTDVNTVHEICAIIPEEFNLKVTR
jgi:hypothetical protein